MIRVKSDPMLVGTLRPKIYPEVAEPFDHASLHFPSWGHEYPVWDTVDLLTHLCHEEDNAQKDG